MLHSHLIFSPTFSLTPSHSHHPSTFLSFSPSHFFNPPNTHSVRTQSRTRPRPLFAQLTEPTSTSTTPTPPEDGPIELPPVFSTTDDPSPLQVATSVLLTGSIAVFLFRALRRRAKRVKELRFRSTGAKKSIKDEALDSLNVMKLTSVEPNSPPSPLQALLGGLAAGVISLILYKFTTTIEASLNRQTMPNNFSVQQITITIRTIINGICYLATFVFGINAIGLVLYAGQLVLNSLMEESVDEENSDKADGITKTDPSIKSSVENDESSSTVGDKSEEA